MNAMTGGVWTPEMDDLLLLRRREQKLPWRAVAPIGVMGEKRCQTRYAFLTSDQARPVVRVGQGEAASVEKDGLVWLAKKKRLTLDQVAEGVAYRNDFRDAGELSMKSCLDVGVMGSAPGPGFHPDAGVVSMTSARRSLFVKRYQVLRGEVDLLTVMDGVCGVGWTVRDLAGGDQARARELEAILRVALNLLGAHRAACESAA